MIGVAARRGGNDDRFLRGRRQRRRPPGVSRFILARSVMMIMMILLLAVIHKAQGRKTMITWVNGIAHTVEHMEEGKDFLSTLFGGKPVVYCYNPTAMAHDDDLLGYANDLAQAGTQKLGYITSEVNSLVQHLRHAVAKVGKRGRVLHIAHSQGALITSLATRQLAPSEMAQMEVLAFGGAAALTRTSQTPFQRCINYYSVNDPLLLLVPAASHALRSGFASQNGAEFCFLAPRVGDPIADHNLFGPTYAQALEWEGQRFQRLYESSFIRVTRRVALLASLVLEVARSTSMHLQDLLKTLLRPILVWCILLYLWTRSLVQTLAHLVRNSWLHIPRDQPTSCVR